MADQGATDSGMEGGALAWNPTAPRASLATDRCAELLGHGRLRLASTWVPVLPERRFQFLSYLAYVADWVPRYRLAHLLWADLPEEAARRNLRHLIHTLGRRAQATELEATASAVRWSVASDALDLREACSSGRWHDVARHRGDLLGGLVTCGGAFGEWLTGEREHVRQWRRRGLLRAAAEHGDRGDHAAAVGLLCDLIEDDITDEEVAHQTIEALARVGDGHRALALFARFVSRLREEYDVEPCRDTRRLAESIRSDDDRSVPTLDQRPRS